MSAAAPEQCRECGAGLRPGAQFCSACGVARSAAAPAAAAPAAAPATTPASGLGFLLPAFPSRLLWSPRKPWKVTTSLSEREVADLFAATMTKEPGLLRRANRYFRSVRWTVGRNAISGVSTATCKQTGPVTIGFGRNSWNVDVDGDTVDCWIERDGDDGPGVAWVVPGVHTTFFGLYLYPAPIIPVDVVKAIRRADPAAAVHHPWSVVRMVVTALAVIGVLGVALGGSSNSGSTSAAGGSGAAQPAVASGDSFEDAAQEDVSYMPDVSDPATVDDIRATLIAFHSSVVAGDFESAWDALTPRKRAQVQREDGYSNWAEAQASLIDHLDPAGLDVSVEDSDPASGVARVNVTGMSWSKPDADCAEWSGLTWVKYENGEWLYDPGYSTTDARRRAWEHRFDELLGGSC